jgi:hypothetical protein
VTIRELICSDTVSFSVSGVRSPKTGDHVT